MTFHHIHDPHGSHMCTGPVPVSFMLQVQGTGPLPIHHAHGLPLAGS